MARYIVDGISTIYMGLEDGGYATGTYRIPPPQYVARERPWYRAAKRAGEVVFTKPYVDWVTGKAVLTVAAPVYHKGRLMGVIAMDTFMDQVVQTVEELRIGEESFAYVMDENGLFMTHPAAASVGRLNVSLTHDFSLFKKFKRADMQMAKGNAVLYVDRDYAVLAAIPVTRWIVMFHLPFSEVNRPLNRLTLILFLVITREVDKK